MPSAIEAKTTPPPTIREITIIHNRNLLERFFRSRPSTLLFSKIIRPCPVLTSPARTQVSLFRDHSEIVKVGHGIGFRPQAYLPRVLESVIDGFYLFYTIVVTDDLVTDAVYPQFMPLPGSHFKIP